MKFSEIVDQAHALLQQKRRSTYRALKLEFDLNDEQLEVLKDELLFAHPEIVDEAGRGLVWVGADAEGEKAKGGKGEEDKEKRIKEETANQDPSRWTPAYLAERILAEREAMEARGVTDGERKSITALFVDVKGSTNLIADLDPEDARTILDPTLKLMMDAVHRYEGYVAQALGDGIFALFGAPIAHEDHPQRALYAALLMQEESRKRAEQLRRERGINVQLRVGVNTGEVVLRSIRKDDLHTDYVPVGQSTHLASRLESLATPGSILVSAQTYKLTEGYFEFKPLGEAQVKGFPEPFNIYEVVGVGPLRTKLQLSVRRGLARFVGRQSEMEHLHRALASAKAGHGQIVGVMGEPGVGKSRLFYEFKLLTQRGCLVLETFSVSHGKAYPYLPLIDLLKNYFQLTNQDDERRRREKITGKVLTLDRSLEDALPYLFFLLGSAEATSPLQQMDGQIRRQRMLEAIKRVLLRESLNQPLLLIFEDLHWLDHETQAFLQLVSESVATARMLLLVNYRPEYQPGWGGKTYFSQVRLDPLGQAQAEEMLTALLGDVGARGQWNSQAEAAPLRQFILQKTEGNPFFMEEIVQDLFEQRVLIRDPAVGAVLRGRPSEGTRLGVPLQGSSLTDLHIPTTVQGVLAARIDRLPAEEKALLQALAVIGKEFSLSLLRHVVDQPEDDLLRQLSRLQTSEFIYERPAFPDIEYLFKHALTQEVAYNSLLVERRKVLHERTAQAMEDVYRDRLEDHYNELARHYSRSANAPKAVEYLQLAGQQAVQRSANAEAMSQLSLALEVLKTLPDTPARARHELTLHLAIGVPLMATKGFSAAEVESAYTRARELCQQIGETQHLFPVLWGLWGFYLVRANLQTARELAEKLLALAQSEQDPALLLQAHYALGVAVYQQGNLVPARAHFEQTSALYEPQQHGSLAFLYGSFDPGVASLSFTALVLWLLGYPRQALRKSQETLALAQALAHPFSLAQALLWTSWFHQLRREERAAQESAEAAIRISTEQGFPQWLAQGMISWGRALAAQGQIEEGIRQIRQGLADYRATGAESTLPEHLARLAEAHGEAGQIEEGLTILADALAQVGKNGEHLYEAELYRLKGELTLQKEARGWRLATGPTSPRASSPKPQVSQAVEQEAEECFLKAIDIARRQQAKSLELRAATSLARLWQQQDKYHEAHNKLSEIYHWFTEGFDTKDLQEARALLEELA